LGRDIVVPEAGSMGFGFKLNYFFFFGINVKDTPGGRLI
jgi:hypothetical protein